MVAEARSRAVVLCCMLAILFTSGCATPHPYSPTAIHLPDRYMSPAGMATGPDGKIYVTVNNAGIGFEFKASGRIARITADNRIEDVVALPRHPVTGISSPIGLDFGSDGNIYVCDSQWLVTNALHASRLIRVTMKSGVASKCDVVVTGLGMPGGVACRGDSVYVCDTRISMTDSSVSGVYRFRLSELNERRPVSIDHTDDPHLAVELRTGNETRRAGATGICFDRHGRMFLSNAGDREIYMATFSRSGHMNSARIFARCKPLHVIEGIYADDDGYLWVADPVGNAVARVSETGATKIVVRNEPGDGSGGALDGPSDCVRRGNHLYIANMDITRANNTADEVSTISVLRVK